MATRDAYELLGIPLGSSASEIKKAFRSRAKELHPDKGGDAKAFAALKLAFEEAVKGAPMVSTARRTTPPAGTTDSIGKYDPFADKLYDSYTFFEPENDAIAEFERGVFAKGCKHCGGRGSITKLVYPEKGFFGRETRFCICQKVS